MLKRFSSRPKISSYDDIFVQAYLKLKKKIEKKVGEWVIL